MQSVKVFKFTTQTAESLEVKIPEVLDPAYGMYVWPSAPVLAQYVWFNRAKVKNMKILELGAGTSLPGIVAAKCGAIVTLTDDIRQASLNNCRKSCHENQLTDVKVVGLSWGLFTQEMIAVPPQDIILASDCFYDPAEFENVVVTIKYFIEKNKKCECWVTYQERSTDWSLVPLLDKWGLLCEHVLLESFEADRPDLAGSSLPGDHFIQMLVIKHRDAG